MAIDVFSVLKQVWPEWQIGKRIGGGSFGVVYEATREEYNVENHAAIKIVSIPTSESELDTLRSEGLDMNESKTYLQGVVNDFVSEIRMMISLEGSSNVVDVKDYKVVERKDKIGWYIFIRMELLTPFDTYICDKRLSEDDVIQLGCDICTALEICAKEKIVHRDIKPGNILVHKNTGCYKLGDFGIARKLENMTGGLSQKGALNYMAPEVYNGSDYDSRVDIYSLGIVLYRLLNDNRMPFLDTEKQLLNPNERRNAIERRIRGENLPPPCKASPEMINLILRACAYDPDMRFSSATEMKKALLSIRRGTYKMSNINGDSNRENSIIQDPTKRVRRPLGAGLSSSESINKFTDKKKNVKSLRLKVLMFCVLSALAVGTGLLAYKYSIESIQANYTGGMVFVEDQLDCEVFEVYGVRKDGNKVKLDDFSISPSELKQSGENEVTITAKGHECFTKITVYEIDSLIANYDEELLPVGSILDKNKITVTGVCTDGTEIVLTDYNVELSQELMPGSNQIRIGYENLETILNIEVEKPIISISFNPNGGVCDESSRIITYSDKVGTLPVIDNIPGYTFAGWTHNGDIIYDDTIITETADIVLVALWEPNTYTITFHSDDDEVYIQEFMYDKAQRLISNKFSKPISHFVGWATTSSGEQAKYSNNESVSNLTAVNGENIDLYAVWELDNSLLLDDLVNDSGTTAVYESASNGFSMFGNTYTGFTVHLGASYNMWGSGTQYCVFNISKWSEVGNVLRLTYGHIDGSENGNRRISIYFDSSDSAAYVFDYDSTNPPKTVDIEISSHESMKIVVNNLSGGQPTVGFSFESIT